MQTNIKKWSVGSPAQSALDATTALMQEERIGPGDIQSIQVHLPTRSARTVDNAPMPDVNVQHLLAMLLIDGALTFNTIHDRERMQDAEVLALRRRITIIPSEELMHARPRRQAIVEAKTRDGRSLSRRTRAVRGSADNPMDQAEVEAKAVDLIGSVLGMRSAHAIVRAMAQLETIPDVTALRRLWQPPAKARGSQGIAG
jgi:2-methylcitrate dehydratase PrpD